MSFEAWDLKYNVWSFHKPLPKFTRELLSLKYHDPQQSGSSKDNPPQNLVKKCSSTTYYTDTQPLDNEHIDNIMENETSVEHLHNYFPRCGF